MRHRILSTCVVGAFAVTFAAPRASAQMDNQTVAWTYVMTPLSGHGVPFQAALAAHAQWRRQQNDPWSWQVYEVVAGDRLGQFIARSGGHSWADLDTYDMGFGPRGNENFGANVAPHLESVDGAISTANWEISNWFDEDPGYTLYQIIQFNLVSGMESQFNRTVARFHRTLQEKNVPWHYVWTSNVVGGDGPAITLVLPYMNWAGMAPPSPTMEQIIFEAVGPEEAMDMFASFGEAVSSTTSWVIRLRPDLSVGSGM